MTSCPVCSVWEVYSTVCVCMVGRLHKRHVCNWLGRTKAFCEKYCGYYTLCFILAFDYSRLFIYLNW